MKKLKKPVNTKVMSEKDKVTLAKNIQEGKVDFSLEVRDSENKIVGFKSVLSLEEKNKRMKELLDKYADFNKKLENCSKKEKKEILNEVKKIQKEIDKLSKIKPIVMADSNDLVDGIKYLESYKENELIESNKFDLEYKDMINNQPRSAEEKEQLMYCAYKLHISKNEDDHIKLRKVVHNGKAFQAMYDELSDRVFYYEIKDGDLVLPQSSDEIYLMKKYNRYFETKLDDYYKEIDKKYLFKKGIVTVALAASLIGLDALAGSPVFNKLPFSSTLAKVSVDLNYNLDEEEKDYIKSCLNAIKEDGKYIKDRVRLYKRLCEVDLNYVNEKNKKEYIKGQYEIKDGKPNISIYNTDSFKDVVTNSVKRGELNHEIGHLLETDMPLNSMIYGNGLSEAVNEQINMEYNGDKSGAYMTTRFYLYALCELFGDKSEEIFKELHYNDSYDKLEEELNKIIDDQELCGKFITAINSINSYESKLYDYNIEAVPTDEIEKELLKTKTLITLTFRLYFEAKYGYDPVDDEVMKAYLGAALCDNVNYAINFEDVFIVDSKGYFNDDYKAKHPYVVVFSGNIFEGTKSIENPDRNQNKKIYKMEEN